MTQEKTVGILGGMGPEATVELMRRIVEKTPAHADSEHISCIVDQNTKIPNRILSIQGKIPSAGIVLADMGQRLQSYGADLLCMPCNTAHFYLQDIEKAVSIPFIDMLACTADKIIQKYPNEKRIGIASTLATKNTNLYKERLESLGLEAIHPEAPIQERLLAVIAEVKFGNTSQKIRNELKDIIAGMRQNQVHVIVMACTELSVICQKDEGIIDALDCLVEEIIYQVKGVKL